MKSVLDSILEESTRYEEETISLQAAASVVPRFIGKIGADLAATTAEGYPGNRFHSGAQIVDLIESECIEQAKAAFKARYANVQPLSCSMANVAVLTSLLRPGDRVLSLSLKHGGHLSHGAPVSVAAQLYETHSYQLSNHLLDYDLIRKKALETQPNLIICGASAYSRAICYRTFRAIADEVGAILLADISHISGLVASGLIASPIDHAHVTTTSTYKQLYGPRGGLILSGKDYDDVCPRKNKSIEMLIQKGLFPGLQGTPDFQQIAQKSLALEFAQTHDFRTRMERVLSLARLTAQTLTDQGLSILSGGTDTHMVILDLSNFGVTGLEAEKLLESVGILANRNLIPDDKLSPMQTSGLRFGTNTVAYRQFDDEIMIALTKLISSLILKKTTSDLGRFQNKVRSICRDYPLRNAEAESGQRAQRC